MSAVILREEREEAVGMLVSLLTAADGSTAGAVQAAMLPPAERSILLGVMTELIRGTVKMTALAMDVDYVDVVAMFVDICRNSLVDH